MRTYQASWLRKKRFDSRWDLSILFWFQTSSISSFWYFLILTCSLSQFIHKLLYIFSLCFLIPKMRCPISFLELNCLACKSYILSNLYFHFVRQRRFSENGPRIVTKEEDIGLRMWTFNCFLSSDKVLCFLIPKFDVQFLFLELNSLTCK